jgi:predicted nucleotidyltransferase
MGMDKQGVLDRLRENERALRARGVTHAALFGSVARGEQRPDSDIDIMVEIAPEARIDLLAYVGIVQFIEELFPVPVDVVNREGLKPMVRPSAEREAVYAF